ncbi:complexin [Brachionus plicatilis]|uniref:Complexin n=1 Tax=Brachionus plicatilis TaxID=10195 RepID=A0A3M7S6Q5_BRAPC|nr:complexin [Brachionus plicatilis]
MAAFIAKQMIGSKLDSVKELAGDKKGGDEEEKVSAEDPELIEQRREEEERRRNKYAKMEAEREKVRKDIRDKYNIKKPEAQPQMVMPEVDNGLNRQKKSPAQLAIDPDEDDFNPVKMATDLFGSVKESLANIPFPWK